MSLRTESADDNFCRNLEVDHDGRVVVSSFLQAASAGKLDAVRKGLESRDRRRLLVAADQQQSIPELRQKLKCKPASPRRSAAHLAARDGRTEVLQLLRDHGCEMEVLDRFGRSPLHLACEHGKASLGRLLMLLCLALCC
eukprot:g33650.t1